MAAVPGAPPAGEETGAGRFGGVCPRVVALSDSVLNAALGAGASVRRGQGCPASDTARSDGRSGGSGGLGESAWEKGPSAAGCEEKRARNSPEQPGQAGGGGRMGQSPCSPEGEAAGQQMATLRPTPEPVFS